PHSQPQELDSLSFPQVMKIYEQQQPVSRIHVLIFDQFEEILTLNPADWHNQAVFFQELGAVLVSRPIWALFSMREEYVGGLDRFVRHLPGQLETTYRLDFLTANAAKIALQEPAQHQGIAFQDEAADELIRRLRTVKVQRPNHHNGEVEAPYVEPFQLQVVCQKLWQRLDKEKGSKFRSIEIGDIKRHADVGRALRAYYADIVTEVARTTKADESVIRDWFETRLITEQHFRSQTQTGPTSGEADTQEILRALQGAYIIRSDTRAGTTWYELSHDHLIDPILEDNKKWRSSRLEPWRLAAREWHGTHREDLLLSGADLRSAQGQARTIHLAEPERQFLDASVRVQERRSLLARTLSVTVLLGLVALAELVVIIVLLVIRLR
ncbi:MAG: nSTAND1 domain-containing NTPase, partial [Isosphaeraceae bacterium]